MEKNMLAFVDDTRKFNNNNNKHPQVHENILDDLKTWQRMSNIIAGKLNISKCGYYILQWHYNQQGYMEMINSDKSEISLHSDANNTTQAIKRYNISDAYKYLGITTAPNGNKQKTIQVLTKICSSFAYDLSRANLTPDEAHLAMTSRFLPKILYQLPCYYLSQHEMQSLQKIYEKPLIQKLGYNHTWPKALCL